VIKTLAELIQARPVATLVVVTGVLVCSVPTTIQGTRRLVRAEQAHAQTERNQTTTEQNAQAIKELLQLKKDALLREAAAKEAIAAQCRAGEIKNKTTCALAGVVLED
jgi:hypothetical protein